MKSCPERTAFLLYLCNMKEHISRAIEPEYVKFAYPPRYVTLVHMQPDKQNLIHHISRLEGQLASIKKELIATESDCEKAALTLKAASRSFSTLRMSFVSCFLEHKYFSKKPDSDSTYKALMQVINA